MEIGVVLILVIVTGTGIGFLGPYYFHGKGQAKTLYVLRSLYSLCNKVYRIPNDSFGVTVFRRFYQVG